MMVPWECTEKGCTYHRREQDFLTSVTHSHKGRTHVMRRRPMDDRVTVTPPTPWEVAS